MPTHYTVPRFRFTSGNYPVGEAVGNAAIDIELFEGELTFPVTVNVIDVAGGSAFGKTMHNIKQLAIIVMSLVI